MNTEKVAQNRHFLNVVLILLRPRYKSDKMVGEEGAKA